MTGDSVAHSSATCFPIINSLALTVIKNTQTKQAKKAKPKQPNPQSFFLAYGNTMLFALKKGEPL